MIRINDVEREIWTGVTKADLITYYHQVAKYILPYLKDRPQSLHIKPVSASAPGFYIKDMEGREPDCASLFTDRRRHPAKGKADEIHYLVCNNEATLLWMVNLGCIDINPWNSRKTAPDRSDYIAIDLDPTVEAGKAVAGRKLKMLLDTAMAAKEFLDSQKLKAFAKTSGKTGMHFFIPCAGFTSPEARTLAELICMEIHGLAPGVSTTANAISSRAGKVYVDPSQNDYADTLAAVYSVRPFHHPTVSTALEWKEINEKLDPAAFTMDVVISRLRKKGDLFKGLLDKKTAIANSKILRRLA